jgi:hypothetical protein
VNEIGGAEAKVDCVDVGISRGQANPCAAVVADTFGTLDDDRVSGQTILEWGEFAFGDEVRQDWRFMSRLDVLVNVVVGTVVIGIEMYVARVDDGLNLLRSVR